MLEKREKSLGLENPQTLTSLHDTALVLKAQKKLEEADVMLARALEGRKKVLGPSHPLTTKGCEEYDLLLGEISASKASAE